MANNMKDSWASAAFRRATALTCCVLLACVTSALAQSPHSTLGDTISVVQLRVPNKARKELQKALDSFGHSDFDGSLLHVNAALALAPSLPNALTLRGYLELQQSDLEAARADFQQALDADPTFSVARLYLGASLNRLGRYDEALQHLERNRALAPGSWEPYFEISKSWIGKQDYQRTLDAINRASSLGADTQFASAVHFMRGRALFGLSHFPEAASELHKTLELAPTGSIADLARVLLATIEHQTQVAAQ